MTPENILLHIGFIVQLLGVSTLSIATFHQDISVDPYIFLNILAKNY